MSYLIGIDLGTSSVRTLICDTAGNTIAFDQYSYDIDMPQEGYAEQDPEMWWKATASTIKNALAKAKINPKEIVSIGLSGQMHGMVLVDKDMKVLRSAIIWCDQRSKKQIEEFNTKIGTEQLGKWALNPIATGFQTASVLWVKENQPDIYEKTYKILLPKDYIRYRLTGEVHTDYTDASSTLAFDTANFRWSDGIMNTMGLDINKYPDVGAPSDSGGKIIGQAALETGLAQGTMVVLGGGDQPMQAIGNGIVLPGTVSCTIGTGGQIFTPVTEPKYDAKLRTHTFCHAVPNTWNIMGAMLSAGLSMKWFKNSIYPDASFKEIDLQAEKISAGSDGLLFLPYLAGERTPHMDPYARGVFFGLTHRHNRAHMARAVMEGVVFALRDSLEIFQDLGIQADRIIASGGGAQSPLWLQIQADIFNREVYTSEMSEQASLGAAIVAAVGAGCYASVVEACDALIKINPAPTVPNKENAKIYDERYQIYKQLYINNADLFKKL